MGSILAISLRRGAFALLFLICFAALAATPATPAGDVHDFDSQHGRWHTSVHRLLQPLSGSQEWADYEGTSVVHSMLGGRANVVELDVSGARGRIEGMSVRSFDAQAARWSIQYTSAGAGALDSPLAGGFGGGKRGVFYGPDTFKGKPVLVRFVIEVVDANTVRFEQSFSGDAGASWEPNWIALDKRL